MFCILIGGSIIAFLPIVIHESSLCPPKQPISWHIEGDKHSIQEQKKFDKSSRLSSGAQNQTFKLNAYLDEGDKDGSKSLLCDELKITDIPLVFFTYCLVVVGWFTMRSTDETAKRAQRAYLVGGPPFGKPRRNSDEQTIKHRAQAHMFEGPWRMTIYNFGQTAGYTVKVEWGLCPRDIFKRLIKQNGKVVLVSELIENELAEYLDKERSPVEIQDIINPTGNDPYQYRHVTIPREEKIGWVFFGRIIYKDVFRVKYYSTFSYELVDEHHNSIGKSLSDDHGECEQ